MNEQTQDELRIISASRHNFQVEFSNITYRVYFVSKVYNRYYHDSLDEFMADRPSRIYCAQYNDKTGKLKKNGFLFNMPMKHRKFIRQWTVQHWITFINIVHLRDTKISELEKIAQALKNSPVKSRDLKRLAKERTRKLKTEIRETDRKLDSFYISVRESALEKAVFA